MKFIDEVKQHTKIAQITLEETFHIRKVSRIKKYKTEIRVASELGFDNVTLEFSQSDLSFYDAVIDYLKLEGFKISEEFSYKSLPFKNEEYFRETFMQQVKISW